MVATTVHFVHQDGGSTKPTCACTVSGQVVQYAVLRSLSRRGAIGAIYTIAGYRLLVASSLAPWLVGSKIIARLR